MELLDTITVEEAGRTRQVQLLLGDLVALPPDQAVDVLVVSAFPNDYSEVPGTLIGDLDRAGVSVRALAKDKAIDLRDFSACWLSRPVARPDLHLKRILCFEPLRRGRPPEVVGDLFRSIIPLAGGDPPIRTIAMPLLAAGDMGESPLVMLEALADASVQWLSHGLDLDCIKIVALPKWADRPELRTTFSKVKAAWTPPSPPAFEFDAFISYCHADKHDVDRFIAAVRTHRPDARLFVDTLELDPGAAWQQHIFESLDRSEKVISLLTPAYVASQACQEEFNIAMILQKEKADRILLPVYLRTAVLPTYMKLFQWQDAREADPELLAAAAARLAAEL